MKIKVNGEDYEINEAQVSLNSLVEKFGGIREGMAVAYNMEVVPRENFQKVFVKEGDSLEIIHAVGGG